MGDKEARPRIQIGYRAGKLTVAEATDQRQNGYTVWRCRCDCGREILLDTRRLQRGTVRDCGCETTVGPGQRDIAGQRFGRLVAVRPTGGRGRDGSLVWLCRCDCGGTAEIPLNQLSSGGRKSCGCLGRPPLREFVGRRFGDLTVIACDGSRERTYFWRCRCRCGRETVVRQNNLLQGHTVSCGCRRKTTYIDNLKLAEGTSVALLEAARSERLISSNSSGHNGVYRNKRSGKWAAQITFKGKTYYLGSYEKIEDAVKVRRTAEERIYGEFLEWYYDTYGKNSKG